MKNNSNYNIQKIAVVIPSYCVVKHIMDTIAAINSEVCKIYVIDDACPEESGKFVETNINDERVTVLYHSHNQGVGGAVMTGYSAAIQDGADIIVKIDNTSFSFYSTEDSSETAWTNDDMKVIYAMKKGLELVLSGQSSRGTITNDTYTLKGFTAAINKLNNDC